MKWVIVYNVHECSRNGLGLQHVCPIVGIVLIVIKESITNSSCEAEGGPDPRSMSLERCYEVGPFKETDSCLSAKIHCEQAVFFVPWGSKKKHDMI